MTQPRERQICLDETPYYHCINRCVRRAFLCGEDNDTGKSFEHRKQWLVDKFTQLAAIFCIDVCAYAVMSNHYHLVLKVNKEQAESLSDVEVAERWYQLFSGHPIVSRWLKNDKLYESELLVVMEIIAKWRERLYEIGWFMRCLNEHVARQANQEDNCKGRFWEGRYKSQALLDEGALLACMMYVDLNPIRAKMADTPEDSDFTSVQQRIKAVKLNKPTNKSDEISTETKLVQPGALLPFSGCLDRESGVDIPFDLLDYLQLIDWTGREIKADKRGAIPRNLSPIFERLGLNQDDWLDIIKDFSRHFTTAAGSELHMKSMAMHTKRTCCRTLKALHLYQ